MLSRRLLSVALPAFLFVALGTLAYSNTFRVPFQFDDFGYIKNNPIIKNSHYFLDSSSIDGLYLHDNVRVSAESRYVGYLSFFLNHKLHGLGVTGYHIVNLAIHIFNTLLVYCLVLLLFNTPLLNPSPVSAHARRIALLAALLFVVHPIQTQAVTYISQRFTLLAALLYLSSVACYAAFRLSRSWTLSLLFYALCLLSAVLAMKTKENAFTLPVMIAVIEGFFFTGRRRRYLYLAPLLLTTLIIPSDIAKEMAPAVGTLKGGTGWQEYLITQLRVMLTYFRLIAFPVNQNLDYDYPIYGSLAQPEIAASAVILISLFASAKLLLRKAKPHDPVRRLVAFGVLWYFISLSVESSVIVLGDVINEHRLYLPAIGLFISVSSAAFLILAKYGTDAHRKAAAALFALMIAALSVTTHSRNAVWSSPVTLWKDVVRKSPGKARAHAGLGFALQSAGDADGALSHHLTALRLKPGDYETHNNLAVIYRQKGLLDKAIKHYKEALRLRPDFLDAHYNVGIAYEMKGDYDNALNHLTMSQQMNPGIAGVYKHMGHVKFRTGKVDNAIEHYLKALQLEPDNAEVRMALSLAYEEKGLHGEAEKHRKIGGSTGPSTD